MTIAIFVFASAFILYVLFLHPAIRAYRRYRGQMLVLCPETQQTTGVQVNAVQAAISATVEKPDIRLAMCSRWPERFGCGQPCLQQMEAFPEDFLVRTILADWYGDRSCVICGKEFETVESYDHRAVFWYDKKPVLISPEGELVEWHEVPAERLPAMLTTHRPICRDCRDAGTVRLSKDLDG